MIKKRVIGLVFLASVLLLSMISAGDIAVESLLLKINLKENSIFQKPITISSQSGGTISLESATSFAKTAENSLTLNPGENSFFNILVNSSGLPPGLYVGSIKIIGSKETLNIPIIVEVESQDVFFDSIIEVPLKYNKISPGEKFTSQIKIFDLTGTLDQKYLGPAKIQMEYSILDMEGNVLSTETETIVVDRQTQLTKSFTFPASAKEGDYIIFAKTTYMSSVGMASAIFSVSKNAPIESIDWKAVITIIAIFCIALLAVIIVFFIFFREKDKFIIELKKYHASELEMQKKLLAEQGKLMQQSGRGNAASIKKEIISKIEELKKKQESRIEELRKLKKTGNTAEMKKKLREWKRKGYSTLVMEYKLKDLNKKDMSKILGKWKKRYR